MFKRLSRYFVLNKRERNGVLILSLLSLSLIICKNYIPLNQAESSDIFSYQVRVNKETVNTKITSADKKSAIKKSSTKNNLFYFDPNKVSKFDMQKLGFSEKLISNIEKYRWAKGSFKNAQDLKKMYGMNESLFNAILPYVQIVEEDKSTAMKKFENSTLLIKPSFYLNRMDTTDLIRCGLLPSLALKIIKYRKYLGGFYSIKQLKETQGMSDTCFNRITLFIQCDSSFIKKLNINLIAAKELSRHPYLNYRQANAIIEYRNRHGDFKTLEDVYLCGVFSPDEWLRFKPYLSL